MVCVIECLKKIAIFFFLINFKHRVIAASTMVDAVTYV